MAQPRTTTRVRQVQKRTDPSTGVVATIEKTTFTRGGNVSEQARRNRTEAGAKNLQAWREQQKANGPDRSIETATAAFRAAFARDVGDSPTVSDIVYLEDAVATITARQLCVTRLKRSRLSLDERLRWTHEIFTLGKQLQKMTATWTAMRRTSIAPPTIADLILESKRLRSGDDDVDEPSEDDDAELEEPEAEKPEPAA
jgi:hypothetical protein